MWRCILRLTTRTNGFVFWRENGALRSIDHRSHYELVTGERPFPLAEICLRMVRIMTKYTQTEDQHERTLLRGEYKYFTGKTCDVCGAQPRDMIAMLQCFGHFGFWDIRLSNKISIELARQLHRLTTTESVQLFCALRGIKQRRSALCSAVALQLQKNSSELSVTEAVKVLSECDAESPSQLVHSLLQQVAACGPDVLTHEECLSTLSAATCLPPDVAYKEHEPVFRLIEKQLYNSAVEGVLTADEIAGFCDVLNYLHRLDSVVPVGRLAAAFLAKVDSASPHALSLMLDAVNTDDFAQEVSPSVSKLLESFSPHQLAAVTLAYSKVSKNRQVDVLARLFERVNMTLDHSGTVLQPSSLEKLFAAAALLCDDSRGLVQAYVRPCVRFLSSRTIAMGGGLDGATCARLLVCCSRLGSFALEAAVTVLLKRLLSVAAHVDPSAGEGILKTMSSVELRLAEHQRHMKLIFAALSRASGE